MKRIIPYLVLSLCLLLPACGDGQLQGYDSTGGIVVCKTGEGDNMCGIRPSEGDTAFALSCDAQGFQSKYCGCGAGDGAYICSGKVK